jgi:hypothetical protein
VSAPDDNLAKLIADNPDATLEELKWLGVQFSTPDDQQYVRYNDQVFPAVEDPSLPEDVAIIGRPAFTVSAEDEAPAVVRPRATRQRGSGVGRHRSEADIQKSCVVRFKHLGGYMIVTTGSRYLPTGTPDSLGCMRGRMVVIEYKRPGEKPTEAQLGQLRRWQLAGALAAWVCSEEQLEHVLTHLDDPSWVNDFSRPGDGRPER